jgi:hypothetical protein
MPREWRKLHNGGLQNLHSSPNTITVIKKEAADRQNISHTLNKTVG